MEAPILALLFGYGLYKVFTNQGLIQAPAKPIFANHRYLWSDDYAYFSQELHSYHNIAPETNILELPNGVKVLSSGPNLFEIGQFQVGQIQRAAQTGTNVNFVNQVVG